MKRFYFAYGMNTNIREMAARCPAAVNLGRCVLQGYELVFRRHADIDPNSANTMEGVLWDITEDCERALDNLEGYPYYYSKVEVIVKQDQPNVNCLNNTNFLAMAYIMTVKYDKEAPSPEYKQCLIEGYAENGLDLSKLTATIDSVIIK